jgi:hypothetical protein
VVPTFQNTMRGRIEDLARSGKGTT